jgi:glutamate-1-semialdehyde 2,1-aminomutase
MSATGNTHRSKELFEQATQFLAGGVASSLHRGPQEEYPIYIERGLGSKVFDVDGNAYIDYVGGYGPLILGYCPSAVDEAIREQLTKGTQFAAPHSLLNSVSQKLTEIIPCAEVVAYQNTGTEAVMLAYRLVRGYTGKSKILKFEGHFHGWADEQLISHAPASLEIMGPREDPVPVLGSVGQHPRSAEDIILVPWNDLELLEEKLARHRDELAGVITEPIMFNAEVVFPEPGFLESLRELTARFEIPLIFDEVITGFRLALGGAQEYFKVVPDLCVVSKAMAGGYPIASVAGRRDIMETGVLHQGTFNANPISVAACHATIQELRRPGVYERMDALTERLVRGITTAAERHDVVLHCDGIRAAWQLAFGIRGRMKDFRDTFRVDKPAYQKLRQACLRHGVRLHPSRGRLYNSLAHTEQDIDSTIAVIERVLEDEF